MKIRIDRTPQYRVTRAIEVGANVPDAIVVELSPDAIPADLRRGFVLNGNYPNEMHFTNASLRHSLDWSGRLKGDARIDAEAEALQADPSPIWETVRRIIVDYEVRYASDLAEYMGRVEAFLLAEVTERVKRSEDYIHGKKVWIAVLPSSQDLGRDDLPLELASRYDVGIREANTEAARRNAEDMVRQEAAEKAKEAEEAASATRKHAQLAETVARLGDESQQARWAEGMLPIREAVDLIVAEAVAPVRAVCIETLDPTPEIAHTDECADYGRDDEITEIEKDETVLTKLWASTYELLRKVRTAVPQGATVEAVKVTATCESCKARGHQKYIRASWKVGEIKVRINIVS